MIISKYIEITISNQGKYYKSLGYPYLKQGTYLSVPVEDLPPNSNKKVEAKCDGCGKIWKATYQSLMKQGDYHHCYQCNRIHVGKIMDKTHITNLNKDQTGNNHPRWNENKDEFKAYGYQVRQLTEEIYVENHIIINPMGKPRTLCGVEGGWQLDHIISIKYGFEHGIAPEEIAELDNLQMLPWELNRNKHYK